MVGWRAARPPGQQRSGPSGPPDGPMARAMGLTAELTRRLYAHLDEWCRLFFLFKSVQTWCGHVTNYLLTAIGAVASFYLVPTPAPLNVGRRRLLH